MNIEPDRIDIIINKTPGYKSGLILFGTFLINELILILKPNNEYNYIICGSVYLAGVTLSTIIFRYEWRKFVKSNIFY